MRKSPVATHSNHDYVPQCSVWLEFLGLHINKLPYATFVTYVILPTVGCTTTYLNRSGHIYNRWGYFQQAQNKVYFLL